MRGPREERAVEVEVDGQSYFILEAAEAEAGMRVFEVVVPLGQIYERRGSAPGRIVRPGVDAGLFDRIVKAATARTLVG